jgi:four helix bundle protein
MKGGKRDPLGEKSFAFAVRIVKMCQYLSGEKYEWMLSKQLLRSGTSVGTMVREAAFAESDADFIHKLSVSRKELSETQYWLELFFATAFISEKEYNSVDNDAQEIGKLLTSSIKTKKSNNHLSRNDPSPISH